MVSRGRCPAVARATTVGLLDAARRGLREAGAAAATGDRYVLAHRAALRAAAAVLAARARPAAPGPSRPPTSAWVLLPTVAPELAEWAAVFAAGAAKRAAAAAGLPAAVGSREADDLLRDADAFLRVVAAMLTGGPPRPAASSRGVVSSPAASSPGVVSSPAASSPGVASSPGAPSRSVG